MNHYSNMGTLKMWPLIINSVILCGQLNFEDVGLGVRWKRGTDFLRSRTTLKGDENQECEWNAKTT